MLAVLLLNNMMGEEASLVTVPDVVGQDQASAVAELEGALFVVAVQTDYSSTVPAGTVISQSPTAGTEAVEGSTVTIVVSLGIRTNTGAGRSRRRGSKYVIRIDGKIFEADSEAEAVHILNQAQALAEKAARTKAEQIVERALPKVITLGAVKPIQIKAPDVQASGELQAAADRAREAIARTYANESAIAEMRLLMAVRSAQDAEEEFLLLH
jgi:hypothetical protein